MKSKVLPEKIKLFTKTFKNMNYPTSKIRNEVVKLIEDYFKSMIQHEAFLIDQIDNVLGQLNHDYYKKSLTSIFNLNFGSQDSGKSVEIEYVSNFGRWIYKSKVIDPYTQEKAEELVSKSDEVTTYSLNYKGSKTFTNPDTKVMS